MPQPSITIKQTFLRTWAIGKLFIYELSPRAQKTGKIAGALLSPLPPPLHPGWETCPPKNTGKRRTGMTEDQNERDQITSDRKKKSQIHVN